MLFKMIVEETRDVEVEVDARNLSHAQHLVGEMYRDGKVDTDSDGTLVTVTVGGEECEYEPLLQRVVGED